MLVFGIYNYHLETASDILREINKINYDKHPTPPKRLQRRHYDVNELRHLVQQGKKPKEIAEILGRSVARFDKRMKLPAAEQRGILVV